MEQTCWLSPRRGMLAHPSLSACFSEVLGCWATLARVRCGAKALTDVCVGAMARAECSYTLRARRTTCAGRKVALSWFRRRDTPHSLAGAETDPSPHFARVLRLPCTPERPLYLKVQVYEMESQHAVLPHTTTVTGIADRGSITHKRGFDCHCPRQ